VSIAATTPRVNILVIVAHGQNGQTGVVSAAPFCQCTDQSILWFIYVLIFVHQNITIAAQQSFAKIVFTFRSGFAFQQSCGFFQYGFQFVWTDSVTTGKAGAGQAHCHSVIGEYG